jgi:ketosteroid isomerase-like protein
MSLTDTNRALMVERAAERAIISLWAALDDGAFDAVANSFAADGVWHRQGKQLKGPAMVRAAMAERPAGARTRHVVTNMLVNARNENSAELSFYLTVYHHKGEPDAPSPAPMNVPLTVAQSKAVVQNDGSGWKISELKSADTFRRQ